MLLAVRRKYLPVIKVLIELGRADPNMAGTVHNAATATATATDDDGKNVLQLIIMMNVC